MAKKTKRVKSAGRFGSRYGVGIRKRVLKVEEKQRQKHICPHCKKGQLKRQATGIYVCSKCGLKIAGGAYTPTTLIGNAVKKMVSQKSFSVSDIIEAEESEMQEGE